MHRLPSWFCVLLSMLAAEAAAEGISPGDIYTVHRGAVVGIQCGLHFGSGFVFDSNQHVATAHHVVACGRDPIVKYADGTEVSARVLVAAPADDLAVIELPAPAGAVPLEPGDVDALRVGDWVYAIGNPDEADARSEQYKSVLRGTFSHGLVSAKSETWIQSDVLVNPGNSGGPLFDSNGRVVGVVARKAVNLQGISFAVPVGKLIALTHRLGKEEPYQPPSARQVTVEPLVQTNFHGFESLGVSVGYGVTWSDRLSLSGRLTALGAFDLLGTGSQVLASRGEIGIEGELAWRFLFNVSTFVLLVSPGVGLALVVDELTSVTASGQLANPACNPSSGTACPVDVTFQRVRTSVGRTLPMFTLRFPGTFQSGLVFQWDTSDVRASVLRYSVTFQF